MHHSSRANKEILEQSNHKDISPHSPPFFFLPFLSQFSSPPFQGRCKASKQASKQARQNRNREKEKENNIQKLKSKIPNRKSDEKTSHDSTNPSF
jgi:hypothetical protein